MQLLAKLQDVRAIMFVLGISSVSEPKNHGAGTHLVRGVAREKLCVKLVAGKKDDQATRVASAAWVTCP